MEPTEKEKDGNDNGDGQPKKTDGSIVGRAGNITYVAFDGNRAELADLAKRPQLSVQDMPVGELDEVADAAKDASPTRNLDSYVSTVASYAVIGAVTGISFGALAYRTYGMAGHSRPASPSLIIGGLCTLAGIAVGVYKAWQNTHS